MPSGGGEGQAEWKGKAQQLSSGADCSPRHLVTCVTSKPAPRPRPSDPPRPPTLWVRPCSRAGSQSILGLAGPAPAASTGTACAWGSCPTSMCVLGAPSHEPVPGEGRLPFNCPPERRRLPPSLPVLSEPPAPAPTNLDRLCCPARPPSGRRPVSPPQSLPGLRRVGPQRTHPAGWPCSLRGISRAEGRGSDVPAGDNAALSGLPSLCRKSSSVPLPPDGPGYSGPPALPYKF